MDYLRAWRGRRVVVTGGTGFIGQHVLRQGLESGVCVHAISSQAREVQPGVHLHQADLNDRERVLGILKELKPEGIIHLAAAGVAYNSNGFGQMLQTNVCGTDNLLLASEAAGAVTSFVMAGSGFEYAPQNRPIAEDDPVVPFSHYGISKAAAAFCARSYAGKMPVTLLRLFSIYGVGEKEPRLVPYVISAAKHSRPVELTNCEQVRDYVYVADAAESFWRTLSHPSPDQELRIINIGSGKAIKLRQLIDVLASILNEKGFTPQIRFGAMPYRPDEPMTYVADIKLLKQTLGWMPTTEIDEGLRLTVDALL